MTAIPKQRPKALDRKDRKHADDALYRRERLAALARDKGCRICGGCRRLETHHVERRSAFGPKRVQAKHDRSNLLTLCHECHELVTKNVLKLMAATTRGTTGPVLVLRWEDSAQDYVVFREQV